MKKPWLSVISPIYNGEKYLSQALDSIIIQQDDNIECIAVDGESSDGTLSILNAYQGKLHLKILQMEKTTNWVAKTNYALSQAAGEYACFLHHDDYWFENRLSTIKRLTVNFPNVVLLLHPVRFINVKGEILNLWRCPLPACPQIIKPDFMLERLLVQNFISILGPVFKLEVALNAGELDESLWYTADWDFWLRMAARGNVLYYPKPLGGFRIHPTSQTMVRSSRVQDFQEQLNGVADKHLALWDAPEPLKRRTVKLASFSNKVNATLAGRMHGNKDNLFGLITAFFLLTPAGWYRYFRDSRIWERVSARLKAQVKASQKDERTLNNIE